MNIGVGQLASGHAADPRNVARLVSYGVAVLSVAAGIIHVSAAADHTNLPVMMAGFLVVATLQVGLGGLLVWRRASRLVLLAAVGMMISSVALWVVSRTAGLPFLPGGHMEPIGFKDSITVLFEIASLPGLFLLMSRDLDAVSLPSPRLGSQALGGLAVGTFLLFTPALVLAGGEHHSADQHAAMEGHGHGDQASASHGSSGGEHPHSGGAGDQADKGHGHGSGDGGAAMGDSSGGHDGHGSSGDELASAGGSVGGGASGDHGSHGGSSPGAGHDDGHGGGDHSGRSETRGGGRGDGGDRGGHGHGDDGGGQGHGDDGGGQAPAGGHGDSHPPADAADDHHGEAAGAGGDEDDGYEGPDGNLTWGPHSLDWEPARAGKGGQVGSGNAFVYRGPPDESSGTVGHHHGSSSSCTPKPTPAQNAAADRLFAGTFEELKQYRNNPARAYADGFTYAFPITDRIIHMVSPQRLYDPTILEPAEVESFLYVQTDRGLWPVGGMYIMPDPDMKGPEIGGCRTKWHRHAGVAGRAVSAGTTDDTGEMLHVYTYPGLDPWGHYDGRALSQFWGPHKIIPSVCRESGDSSDACLP